VDNRERDEKMKRDGRRERGRAKIIPLLKLKTKQAKVVVVGDLLARGRGQREGKEKKVEIGAKT
jgi:hypothetical protein